MPDYKLIYLARRNPALREDEFPEVWREHSRLASRFVSTFGAHFRSVNQCVKARELGAPPAFRNDYDGACLIGMKSWDDLVAARSHPRAQQELQADELRVFAGLVDPWTMAVEEQPVREGAAGDHVMLAFLAPRAGLAPGALDAGLASLARALDECAGARTAGAITIDRVIEPAKDHGFAAVVELWFTDGATMLAAARDEALSRLLACEDIAGAQGNVNLLARLNLTKTGTATPQGEGAWTEGLPARP